MIYYNFTNYKFTGDERFTVDVFWIYFHYDKKTKSHGRFHRQSIFFNIPAKKIFQICRKTKFLQKTNFGFAKELIRSEKNIPVNPRRIPKNHYGIFQDLKCY